jgi:hypothetical protein
MRFNKNRVALLAGLSGRDEYFGKSLNENFSYGGVAEAEDDLDVVEDEDEAPIDVEGGEEEAEAEADAGEMVSKEDVAAALADVLGVDSEELSALVSGDEEDSGDEEEDLGDLDLGESDRASFAEARVRAIIRKEINSIVLEARRKDTESQIRTARRKKSVAALMGYKK